MKLARGIRTGGAWIITEPYSIVDKPPVGTIVQYEPIINGVFRVYFPGVRGYASISGWVFGRYFKDLDDETS